MWNSALEPPICMACWSSWKKSCLWTQVEQVMPRLASLSICSQPSRTHVAPKGKNCVSMRVPSGEKQIFLKHFATCIEFLAMDLLFALTISVTLMLSMSTISFAMEAKTLPRIKKKMTRAFSEVVLHMCLVIMACVCGLKSCLLSSNSPVFQKKKKSSQNWREI